MSLWRLVYALPRNANTTVTELNKGRTYRIRIPTYTKDCDGV